MAKKKSVNFFALLIHLLEAHIKRVSDLLRLVNLEAKLAGKSLLSLIFIAVLMLLLLGSTWLSILGLLFFSLLAAQLSPVISSAIVLGVNILALLLSTWYVQRLIKRMSFPATRRQLAAMHLIEKEVT
jgi:uncharacterized membrane protein YqjE